MNFDGLFSLQYAAFALIDPRKLRLFQPIALLREPSTTIQHSAAEAEGR